jgi:hypothetical protein
MAFLKERGLPSARDNVAAACVLVPGAVAEVLHCTRQEKLRSLGVHAAADDWEEHLYACGGLEGLRQAGSSQQDEADLADIRGAGGSGWDGWGSQRSSGGSSLSDVLQDGCSVLR